MYHRMLSKSFFALASFAGLFAMFGWAVEDVWLASSQWLQVSAVLILIAIYVWMVAEDDEALLKCRPKKKKKKYNSFQLAE